MLLLDLCILPVLPPFSNLFDWLSIDAALNFRPLGPVDPDPGRSFSQSCFSWRLSIFPLAFLGISDTKNTPPRSSLNPETFPERREIPLPCFHKQRFVGLPFKCCRMSATDRLGYSGLRTMKAAGTSPATWSGRPSTAQSATPGRLRTSCSTSVGDTCTWFSHPAFPISHFLASAFNESLLESLCIWWHLWFCRRYRCSLLHRSKPYHLNVYE